MSDVASSRYFDSYGVMQMFKHLLLKRYLHAWFPILGSSVSSLLYIETHAGKGKHKSGESGSPLVAMDTFRQHARAQNLLARCNVKFHFMELNPDHVEALRTAVEEIKLPGINVTIQECNFADSLEATLTQYRNATGKVLPAFVFVDPFNYNIPVRLLRNVLSYDSCEVMVTFMAQDVVMAALDAAKDSKGKAENLTAIFGGENWRKILETQSFEAKLDQAVSEYATAVGSKWSTTMRMEGNRCYALIHFTNSNKGREEMKRAMWDVTKAANKPGVFCLSSADDPQNAALLVIDPDLAPLQSLFRSTFLGKRVTREMLEEWCHTTNYVATQLNDVIRDGVKDEWIEKHFSGPIGPSMGEITVKKKDQEALF